MRNYRVTENEAARNLRAMRLSLITTAVALIIFVPCAVGWSQDFRQYREYDRYRYLPRLPEGPERPSRLPLEEREVTGDPKVLVEELKGLMFVDHPDLVVQEQIDVSGIQIHEQSDLWLLRGYGFREVVEPYLGQPVSLLRLNELVRDVIRFYRDNDLPVVDVTVPPQDITNGVVQLVVTEGRVGRVRVEGTNYFDPNVLVNQMWINPGDRIYESDLLEDLRWLQRNPFRVVDLKLSPGAERGETDIVFNVLDKRPVRAYAGYEDTGTRALGLERTFYGINWHNALWRDDQVGYQYTASSDFNRFDSHSAFYSTALYNRDIITLYGNIAEFNAPIPGFLFSNEGQIWQLLLRYYRELCPIGCYEHAITAGFDFKRIDSTLQFGPIPILESQADVAQFLLGYYGSNYDWLGSWHIGVDAYFSPGHLSGRNTSANFATVRPFAAATYFYTRAFFERRVWLTSGIEAVARVTGQVAEGNLLPTEQLGFGGYNSIRGYDLYSVVTDSGYFVNLELQTAPIYVGVGQHFGIGDEFGISEDELRLLAFYDFGDGYNHALLPGEDPSVDLGSVGVGLRYALQRRLTLRADYGWQLSQISAVPTPRERIHIGVVLSH